MFAVSGVSLLLILACLWGLSFPAIAVGLEFLPPLLFAALRYDVATVLLLAYAVSNSDNWVPSTWRDFFGVAGGGVFLIGSNGLLFVGQQTVPSGVASILQALVPIFTVALTVALVGRTVTTLQQIGVVIGLVGTALIVQPDPTGFFTGDATGRLLLVLYAVILAFGSLIVEHADPSIDRDALTAWSMLIGAGVLHVSSFGYGESLADAQVTITAVAAVAFLAIFATAFAFAIYFRILETQGAFEANLVAYLVPPVSILTGVAVLGESINAATIVGFATICAGFVVLNWESIPTPNS
jgi:drug/metabolite transporter (DMT)-like permease